MKHESLCGWSVPSMRARRVLRRLLGDVLALIAFTAVLAMLWVFGVGSP